MLRAFALLLFIASGVASADPYDFKIFRLGNPSVGGSGYTDKANGNFRVFARQMAAAITSATLMPPETLGHAGFAFSAEISAVSIVQDSSGQSGIEVPTQSRMSDYLLIPSVHIRKGLPYSFELGARLGWFEKSRMFTGQVELKWALNEGFTYLPDIAVGGRICKLINSRDFDLTTGGLDISVGKQFALAGMVTLTPYIGWNLMFVGSTSNPVDFDPQRSLAEAELPSEEFRDIYVFDSVSSSANTHNRFYFGVRFIGAPFMLGFEVSYTLGTSFRDEAAMQRNVPAVLAINGMVGVDL